MMDGKKYNFYQMNSGRNADNQQKNKTNSFGLLKSQVFEHFFKGSE